MYGHRLYRRAAGSNGALITMPSVICTILLLFVVTGIGCSPVVDQEFKDVWQTWKTKYGKVYQNEEEEAMRKTVWLDNVGIINKHKKERRMGQHKYELGVNQFSDMTDTEFANIMTRPIKIRRTAETNYRSTVGRRQVNDIPDDVDYRKEGYVTSVKDQGNCSAGYAFAAAGALEGQKFRKTSTLTDLSAQNLIDCSSYFGTHGCSGGEPVRTYYYMSDGIENATQYPYTSQGGQTGSCKFNPKNADGYVHDWMSGTNEEGLRILIAGQGPVAACLDASQPTFKNYKSGIYMDQNCSTTEINHCVLIVGYNTTSYPDYYIVKNSWGTDWGMDGYAYIAMFVNQCGIGKDFSVPFYTIRSPNRDTQSSWRKMKSTRSRRR